ncbi:hypothetical protein MD484_g7173, partial [Candolleomyces efflorescens]
MPAPPHARLASQHHLSPYNTLRHGPQGAPLHYLPLSLAAPEPFRRLQQRQLHSAEQQTAWRVSPPREPDLSDQIQAAINEPLAPHRPTLRLKTSMSHPIKCALSPPATPSVDHTLSISCLLPPESLPVISSHALPAAPPSPVLLDLPAPFHVHQPELPDDSLSSISLSLSIEIPNFHPLLFRSSLKVIGHFSLGNLYMSSCPGKKVRLNGPSNGRSAVCRDLDMDMTRIKSFGIGCIIWYIFRPPVKLILTLPSCLDDEELSLLGAPWASYEKSAQNLGIDILRLPIPEGLPPSTVEEVLAARAS